MNRLLFVLVGFILAHAANGQMFQNQEQITRFGNRLNSPVTMRVEQTGNTLSFYAENKSYYPYKFQIRFTKLVNLSPRTAGETRVLRHGMTRVLKLTVENQDEAPDYSYTIQYAMGDPSKEADEDFPYLLPIAPGKAFEPFQQTITNINHILVNSFKAGEGDIIFAMRKGFVASLPDGNGQTDQIDEYALEIIHEDGSVALYKNIAKSLVKYNQEVLPGEAIGIMNSSGYVSVRVYDLSDNRLTPISLKFAASDTSLADFMQLKPGSVVQHPASVIEKELSPKEIKKLKKSKR